MKKRFRIIICTLLTLTLLISAACIPASSYEPDVVTSTADMILVNTDTNTVVFSQKPDNKWYLGDLVTLITYLVASDSIEDPAKVTYKVEKSFIDNLPFSDGCLDAYVGQTLTAKDLMAIMLLSYGNDAAYALVELSGYATTEEFVTAMNDKVAALGCTKTLIVSPGYSENSKQHTTCREMYYIYSAVRDTKLFNEIEGSFTYTPEGFKGEEYTVENRASIMNPNSPYYFKYVNDAKYSYGDKTYEGIAMTTTYRDKTYFFAGLLGKGTSEENVYADAKKLTTWAYLNLSDRKVINAGNSFAKTVVNAGWGSYEMELHPFSSAYKTLPNDFEESKLSYDITLPKSVNWPLAKGQSVGKAQITYDSEPIENIDLVSESEEGLDMLSDAARFGSYVWGKLLVNEPATQPPTEPAAQPSAESATQAVSETATQPATEAATEKEG